MDGSSSFCGSLLAGMRARGQGGLASPAPVAEDSQRSDGVASRAIEATPLPLIPLNLALADYMWDFQRQTPLAPQKIPGPAPTSAVVLRNLYARELHSAEAAADAAFGRAPQSTDAGPHAAQPPPSPPKAPGYVAAAAKGGASPWAQAAAIAAAPVEE